MNRSDGLDGDETAWADTHEWDESADVDFDSVLDDAQSRDEEELLASLGLTFEDSRSAASEVLLPVVAVVGRPNVGKSTLVNRIIGRREAVVEDLPGVTRDRVRYETVWAGREFVLLDTGGYITSARGLAAQVAAQAERAINEADVVMFVVDATVGSLDEDEAVVKLLRQAKVPVVLVANKVDDARTEADAATMWNLGLGQPWPVSALHGRGSGDMLDAVVAALPEQGRDRSRLGGPRRLALVGRPNVGKSSLLNALAGDSRVVVHDIAGTTVDPVDELVEMAGRPWILVDTAGIRRKVDQASGHEWYASLRTHAALEKADIALVVIDAATPLAEQDVRVATMAAESGRAVVMVYNKWDLVDVDRQEYFEREVQRDLHMMAWAPRVNLSARTAWHVNRLVPALDAAWNGWTTRVPTHRLNRFLAELVAAHPHPVRGGKQSKILFGTQVGVCPPAFALFTSGALDAGYCRFVERRLREEFGFAGSPIRIMVRIRRRERNR
jgi:GTP-binding protein